MQVNAAAIVNELEIYKERCLRYEQIEIRNKELESAIIELKDYQNKYLELKEMYDLLVYKRFGRSAEQLLEDAIYRRSGANRGKRRKSGN